MSVRSSVNPKFLVAVALAAVALGAAACGGSGTSQTTTAKKGGAGGGDLRVAWTIGPTTFDPAKSGACMICNAPYLNAVYDRLIESTTALTLKPMLATSWKFEGDDSFVMALRQGVKFQDGTPFDAKAVKANIERTKTLPEATVVAKSIDVVKSVEVVDDHTVRLAVEGVSSELPYALAGLAGMMISPAAFSSDLATKPVGAGAFRLVKATTGDSGVANYARFDGYWNRTAPFVDKLSLQGIPDDNQRLNALLAGNVDAVNVKLPTYDRAQGAEKGGQYKITRYKSKSWVSIFLNSTRPPFDDIEMRRAIAQAIDKDAIISGIAKGRCENATQPLPPEVVGHDPAIESPAYDPDQAGAAFAAKGPSATSLKLLVLGTQPSTDFATAIQAQLKKAGVNAKLDVRPPSDVDQIWAERSKQYNGYVAIKDASPSPGGNFAQTDEPYNPGGWSADVKRMVQAAERATSPDEQQSLWAAASRRMVDEVEEVWLCYPPFAYIHATKVGNSEVNPLGPLYGVDPSRWTVK